MLTTGVEGPGCSDGRPSPYGSHRQVPQVDVLAESYGAYNTRGPRVPRGVDYPQPLGPAGAFGMVFFDG